MCLTAKGLGTILCLLATLPVGFSRPYIISRIRAIPSEEQFCVVATRPFPVAVGRERDTFGCASLR